MSWYRTYRPQRIEQLHLADVRKQLQNMLKSGELPQAFLFTGPKGTGKTSSARIIAKVFNCSKNAKHKKNTAYTEPCTECESCVAISNGSAMNVIEIDAASHRGIDHIRELREQIYYPPAQGEKLVYIIDEVHMLTKEAFNALLKILEEPPAHAVFILATTESHKILDTIVSRCTVVQFHVASDEELQEALSQIAQKEKISVDEVVWPMITQQAQGSFRDAVKLFEQVVRQVPDGQSITSEVVEGMFSVFSNSDAEKLIQSVLAKDEKAIAQFFSTISQKQFDVKFLHAQILSYLHQELLKALGVQEGKAISTIPALQFLLKNISLVSIDPASPYPWLTLELCLLEMVLKSKVQGTRGKVQGGDKNSELRTQKSEATENSKQKIENSRQKLKEELTTNYSQFSAELADSRDKQLPTTKPDVIDQTTPVVTNTEASPELLNGNQLFEQWSSFLQLVKQKNLSLEALLRSAKFARGEHGKAVIEVFYKFHKEQLELERHRRILEDCILSQLGGLVKVEFVLATATQKADTTGDDNLSGKVESEELAKLAEEALL